MTRIYSRYIGFKEYIDTLKIVPNTSEGDFINDAHSDSDLPNARSWRELEHYLLDYHYSEILDNVIVGAKIVWRQYRAKYPEYLAPRK